MARPKVHQEPRVVLAGAVVVVAGWVLLGG